LKCIPFSDCREEETVLNKIRKLELVKFLPEAQLASTKPAFVTLRPSDSSVGIAPHPPISSRPELGGGPSDGGNLLQFLTEDLDSTAW